MCTVAQSSRRTKGTSRSIIEDESGDHATGRKGGRGEEGGESETLNRLNKISLQNVRLTDRRVPPLVFVVSSQSHLRELNDLRARCSIAEQRANNLSDLLAQLKIPIDEKGHLEEGYDIHQEGPCEKDTNTNATRKRMRL